MTQQSQQNFRPQPMDKEIIESVIPEVYDGLTDWLDEYDYDYVKEDVQRHLEIGILSLLDQSEEIDGFKLTNFLRDVFKWNEANSELVRILDGVQHIHKSALRAHVRQWVKEHNLQPRLQIGDAMSLQGESGSIVCIYAQDGTYGFMPSEHSYGHRSIYEEAVPFELMEGLGKPVTT